MTKTSIFLFGMISLNSIAQTSGVGTSIQGDFDGNGKKEFAFSVQTREGEGNPMEDGIAAEYVVNFSDEKIPSLGGDCCEIVLVNEGDLNNDGNDEISIWQYPVNGSVFSFETHSFKNGKWEVIVPRYLLAPKDDYLTHKQIQALVVLEKGQIYYYDTDVNDEDMPLVKRKL